MRRPHALTILVLCAAAFPSARAQQGLAIRAATRDTVTASATVTAAFLVTNTRRDVVSVLPHIELPREWTLLVGDARFSVAPDESAVLMVSIVVPARAPAGVYPVRAWVTTSADAEGTMDSVAVLVPQRRALHAALLDRPAFVISGRPYEVAFLLRNRGNLATDVRLVARSSMSLIDFTDSLARLGPDESRVVRALVRTPPGIAAATDDVVELLGSGDGVAVEASSRVTVVPEPERSIDEFLRIPTQVRLRAASSNVVAPFEILGRGPLRDGGDVEVDFTFRGRSGTYSPFGERDEYRAQLTAPTWRARLGDQLFMLSPLTGGAQPGFGVGADATRGAFSFGAHGQEFRRDPARGTEIAGFVKMHTSSGVQVTLNGVDRQGGILAGQVASAAAAYDDGGVNAQAELARAASGGFARHARLSGATDVLSYDVGHQHADTSFTGAQRGARHDYLTASWRYLENATLVLNGGRHHTDLSRATGVPYAEQFDLATLSTTFLDRFTWEIGAASRSITANGARDRAEQFGSRVRADQPFHFGTLTFETEVGRARADGATKTFTDVMVSGRRSFRAGDVALWSAHYSGGSISKGATGAVTVGGDLSAHLSRTTDLTLRGYATRLHMAVEPWQSQLEAFVTRALPNGSTISLRALLLGGSSFPGAERGVAYLEYGLPLRIPISRLRTPGRVVGRVVDATTREGVAGALVRLGPQVAITDKRGQVAFGGVPGGQHRLSMSQETSFADAVFVGDPTLHVDSTREQPTTFELAVARGARVAVSVRRVAAARLGVAGTADSLVDIGPLANASLILTAGRDTLYRTTNDEGAASFADVPPGDWAVAIRGDAPAYHRFEPDRVSLSLSPGEAKSVTFRLLPRRREVQLIGTGQELTATPADPKASPQGSTTRAVRPRQNR